MLRQQTVGASNLVVWKFVINFVIGDMMFCTICVISRNDSNQLECSIELIEWYVYKLVQLNPKYISNDFFTINYSLDISDRILYL